MKIIIELPNNWLDADFTGNIDFMFRTVRETIKERLADAIMKQIKPMPRFKFSNKELREKILNRLADRAADNVEIK